MTFLKKMISKDNLIPFITLIIGFLSLVVMMIQLFIDKQDSSTILPMNNNKPSIINKTEQDSTNVNNTIKTGNNSTILNNINGEVLFLEKRKEQ